MTSRPPGHLAAPRTRRPPRQPRNGHNPATCGPCNGTRKGQNPEDR